mgnify:CR=1 FL=1
MASIDYYEDQDLHGNYQYVTLEEVINNYLMSRDMDDYSAMTPRYKILYHAQRGIRELYYDVVREIRAISMELSPALTITLPPDFVSHVRISWVDDNGQLHPMAIDNRINIAQEYLQDHDFSLLFDNEGCVLEGDTLGDTSDPESSDSSQIREYSFCSNGYQPNRNMSNYFPNGKFKIDKNAGVIYFGSDAEEKNIVLEYISDGLFTGCEGRPEEEIRVHKFAETALLDYIHHSLIKNRRNVPYNEKIRSRKEYWNSRRLAKMRINPLRKEDLLQLFSGQSKQIK